MTLAEIRAASNPTTFPVERLAGMKTAAAFYCAAFHGRQDVIHLVDAGLVVVGVDTDEAKLEEMQRIYGPRPGFDGQLVDAFVAARSEARMERRHDVVTVDPWTQDIPAVMDRLDVFAAIAGRLLVAGVSRQWMEGRGLSYTGGDLQLWTVARALPLRVVELRERSNHLGGIAWGVWEVTR